MDLLSQGWVPLVATILAIMLGGILKGATGAGAPILAVPVIAMFYDVRSAVVVMILPSLLSNVLQAWRYRVHLRECTYGWWFAAAGMVGAVLGTLLLANVAPRYLLLTVAALVFLYVGFRLARPGWQLAEPAARRLALPAGLGAGILQGATGLSAPISLTYLNACGLARPVFVAVVSLYFVASTLTQIVALASYGFLSAQGLVLSAGALGVILLMMPVGEIVARRFSRRQFDILIQFLLTAIALRILLSTF